jgi:hypothetical protein
MRGVWPLVVVGCAHPALHPPKAVVATAESERGLPAPDADRWAQTVLYRAHAHTSRTRAAPRPGDLVVFNDGTTGVVIDQAQDRVRFLYVKAGAVREGVLSTKRPGQRRDTRGQLLNSYVHARHESDPPGTRYLAGECVAAFEAVEPDD